MAINLVDLAETIESLTAEEKQALNILMGNESKDDASVDTLLRSLRFAEKRVCPFCSGTYTFVYSNFRTKRRSPKFQSYNLTMNPIGLCNASEVYQ